MVENFNTYTKVDPNNHISVSADGTRVTATGITRGEIAYLYKDYAAGHFADFTIDFDITTLAGEAHTNGILNHLVLSNSLDVFPGLVGNCIVVTSAHSPSAAYIMIGDGSDANRKYDGSFSRSTVYYLRLTRASGVVSLQVFSNSGRTNLLWNSGPLPSTITTTFRYAMAMVSANVAGGSAWGASGDTANVNLGTGPGPNPPVAHANGPYSQQVNVPVQFNGTADNGTGATWDWNFGDGSAHSNQQNPTHTYASVGNYTATLTVTTSGGSDSDTATVTISNLPTNPTANPDGPYSKPSTADTNVQFVGNASGGTPPYTYLWTFDTSNPAEGTSPLQSPTHIYPAVGKSYNVSLRVTDNLGYNDTKFTTVSIGGVTPPGDMTLIYIIIGVGATAAALGISAFALTRRKRRRR